MIKQIIANMRSMMRSKSGKIAVGYCPPHKYEPLDFTATPRTIDNFYSRYSGKTYERIVVPMNWENSRIEIEIAKHESEGQGVFRKIDCLFFKMNVKTKEKREIREKEREERRKYGGGGGGEA